MKPCPRCKYELDGVPEVERRVRCPECGGMWAPVDFVPRRTILRRTLIGGVVPWAFFLAMIVLLPALMLPERAGPWVWRVGVASAAMSLVWTIIGFARNWTASIRSDRMAVAGIVAIANAAGLFVAYVVYLWMVAAGC